MLRIGKWIRHPQYGVGRIADHKGTRYLIIFPGGGGPVEIESREPGITEADAPHEDPIKVALREVLEEYGYGGVAALAGRWEGGEIVVRSPSGAKEHRLPVDALFHKVVMIRDRLRVLEQKINANKQLTDAAKVELQQYVTRSYGSLTSLNFLFKDDEDKFSGQSG
jgi:hypothetical protein